MDGIGQRGITARAACYELACNPTKPMTADDIAQTRRSIRELTKVGEREIHEVVLSCTRGIIPKPLMRIH